MLEDGSTDIYLTTLTLKWAQIEGTSDKCGHKPVLRSELESIIKQHFIRNRLLRKVIFIHSFSVITFMGNTFVISIHVSLHSWDEEEAFWWSLLAWDSLVPMFPYISGMMGINRTREIKGDISGHKVLDNRWLLHITSESSHWKKHLVKDTRDRKMVLSFLYLNFVLLKTITRLFL